MASNIISFALEDHEISLFLNGRLRDTLPVSLPIFRRCQFHLKELRHSSHSNNSAEVWVSVAANSKPALTTDTSPSSRHAWLSHTNQTYLGSTSLSSTKDHIIHEEWIAAHIDLSNPGETQIWLFGSWELEQAETDGMQKSTPNDIHIQRINLFQSLYRHLRQVHVKRLPTVPPCRWRRLLNDGKIVSTPYCRSKVLFGTVSEVLWPYLEDDIVQNRSANQVIRQQNTQQTLPGLRSSRTRQDLDYLKYLMPVSKTIWNSQQPLPPPTGFRFGPLSDEQLQLMLDRTVIPRTLETLKSLVSVGLYPVKGSDGTASDPIAWGLLGKDASISSLHTETDYRGRGLAENITNELIRRQKDVFRSDWLEINDGRSESRNGPAGDVDEILLYAHTDVSKDNVASRRVFEKMGAKTNSTVGWIEIDIGE